jgi:hypothetical protein
MIDRGGGARVTSSLDSRDVCDESGDPDCRQSCLSRSGSWRSSESTVIVGVSAWGGVVTEHHGERVRHEPPVRAIGRVLFRAWRGLEEGEMEDVEMISATEQYSTSRGKNRAAQLILRNAGQAVCIW